ncbi:MAG: circularly permuted type 2 ATP-grasp protein [Sphingomonas sp.]|uniref:circularly permuted type 2 ATP-grasp protein n=1 Tax=Sphingomonas sp. TaxID=28214 RepID=UPI001AC7473B|nr:circularly permuted type 2 ATP-grasp protein [Sphingomonas sp.]MBN8817009.1 circularly permuted type 2 ATP-grasp protein [Sphingomonas sp.]
MASQATSEGLFDASAHAARWLADYRGRAGAGDVVASGDAEAWTAAFEELAIAAGDDLGHARQRVQRHAEDIGTGFRVAGDSDERPWPVSPIPLLIAEDEWQGIAAGAAQRAALLETVLADLYGEGRLVADGTIPAALVNGSPLFLRPMVGLTVPGGYQLQFVAFDLGRGPDGEWRVLADHVRSPVGAGYALENRLATSRTLGGLQGRLNILRHAPFFAAFREGLAELCKRAEPRIGLLTPGRWNASYAEQAHLARYLGFLLVEGADLTVAEDRLYVRTIAGLKRVDALWQRADPRLLDPLAFDSHSQIGVAGLIDAFAAHNVLISNAPGAGVLEAPAMQAFLPLLAERLTGEKLRLPNVATWWCGADDARALVEGRLDELRIAPAFGVKPLGLPDGAMLGADLSSEQRAALLADLARRPEDYVGQETVRLSTMPVVADNDLAARPFTLRVFAARAPDGGWAVLPGGFARIGAHADDRAAVMGDGLWSADVTVHSPDPVAHVSLLPATDSTQIRRNPGTLPSRVADNFFWLGRYLERGEALLTIVRVMLGNSIDADAGAALDHETVGRMAGLVVAAGAAAHPERLKRPDLVQLARTALDAMDGWHNIPAMNRLARNIAGVSRDRLSADMCRLLDAPHPTKGSMLDRCGSLQRRYAALSGLAAEHMGRTASWRFHDLGRRVERGVVVARLVRTFGMAGATADDLSTLLDLADSQISYRQRYLTGIARVPVVDLVALDPGNPRSLAYQVDTIAAHLDHLPVLNDDGLPEDQQAEALALKALLATANAAHLEAAQLFEAERQLTRLSEAIARRYFLQGAEPLRAGGLTLA